MLIVSFAWNRWHRFSGCLPAHSNGCLFFRAGLCVHFSCFAPVASFPALYFTYLLLARNWLCIFTGLSFLHLFLRVAPVASFPTLENTCIIFRAQWRSVFSRARPDLHPLPGLTPVQSFPYLTQVAFFIALCPVPFFPRLNQLASSFAVDAGSIFFPRLNQLASSYAVDAGCVFSRS